MPRARSFFTPNIKSYAYHFKIPNQLWVLCKFNVHQHPKHVSLTPVFQGTCFDYYWLLQP